MKVMSKEFKKHLERFCDVSNSLRMRTPDGKKNLKAGEELAEEMLRLMLRHEPGYDGTAIMLTALGLVNQYVKKAIPWSNAVQPKNHDHLMEMYENLFQGEFWMRSHHDSIMLQIAEYIKGDEYYRDELKVK